MLEEIHRRLTSSAAEMLADFFAESPQEAEISACVRAGGRLMLEIDYPRSELDEWRVRIILNEPRGKRYLLADVAQSNCTQ